MIDPHPKIRDPYSSHSVHGTLCAALAHETLGAVYWYLREWAREHEPTMAMCMTGIILDLDAGPAICFRRPKGQPFGFYFQLLWMGVEGWLVFGTCALDAVHSIPHAYFPHQPIIDQMVSAHLMSPPRRSFP